MGGTMPKKKFNSITLRGSAANDFLAEMMVDIYGEKARENCEGPALAAINRVLAQRAPGAGPGSGAEA